MRFFVHLLCWLAITAYGQTTLNQTSATDEQSGAPTAQDSLDQNSNSQTPQTNAPPEQQNPSALGITPGTQAIKEKDLYEKSGYLHPFQRMPGFVLIDQKRAWTSPFHISRKDIKWWAIFGGATAALIAADQHIEKAAPSNPTGSSG